MNLTDNEAITKFMTDWDRAFPSDGSTSKQSSRANVAPQPSGTAVQKRLREKLLAKREKLEAPPVDCSTVASSMVQDCEMRSTPIAAPISSALAPKHKTSISREERIQEFKKELDSILTYMHQHHEVVMDYYELWAAWKNFQDFKRKL